MNFFDQLPSTAGQPDWSHLRGLHQVDLSANLGEGPILQVVVVGAIDVVIRPGAAQLVVAAASAELAGEVRINRIDHQLVIIAPSGPFPGGNIIGNNHVIGSGNVVIGGRVITGGSAGEDLVVGLALPDRLPALSVQGSGNLTVVDIDQQSLQLDVQGSGNIEAVGKVTELVASVMGSGDIDASELPSDNARLAVQGSGDIDALVHKELNAEVHGSGDIRVRGRPARKDTRVTGSGSIRVK